MLETKKKQQSDIETFLKELRNQIVEKFSTLEKKERFQKTTWNYQNGQGGGEISLLKGEVFEKAAVNWSGIRGDNFPMNDGQGPFYATGVSLITHMRNPHAPTVHMNVRYIETKEKSWFAGGYDLTPMGFPYSEDTTHFHSVAKKTLTTHGKDLYENFSKEARDYFYIPHRKKERGVGGIFFDHYNTGNFDADYAMWQDIGRTFLDAIMPIYEKRIETPYERADKETQNKMRAHYVEFNLIYDRGTKFGFQSGGNPEAILCSMPPEAKW